MDVIKKAYLQEEERENSEVSPREVGHNIYILALQVPVPPVAPWVPDSHHSPGHHAPQPPCPRQLPSPPSRHCHPQPLYPQAAITPESPSSSPSHHALVTVLPFPSALQAQ